MALLFLFSVRGGSSACEASMVFAETKLLWAARTLLEDARFLLAGLALAGALLLGAVVIALVRRWQRTDGGVPSVADQLGQFRSLYEKGEISQEEFERLRAHLTGRASPPPEGIAGPDRTRGGQVPTEPPGPPAGEGPAEGTHDDRPA